MSKYKIFDFIFHIIPHTWRTKTVDEYKLFDFIFTVPLHKLAMILEEEAWQTRAYILSFAPNVGYVEKILAIYNNAEFTEFTKNYLNRVEDKFVNTVIAREVERVLEKKLSTMSSGDESSLRKNMIIGEKPDNSSTP
ncbi:hypothetical protein AGMMS49546_25920 [Spirochaetia bacterium]|nr:hypothetical protein AGMMS49546_25920 [Spirochaetia bacterium]